VRLNEAQVNNVTGPTDDTGEHDPWIELHNRGAAPAPLAGWYLTDSLDDLTRWPFPDGYGLADHGYELIWADGEPGEGTLAEPHTKFRLAAPGVLALVRMQNGQPAVVDYLRLPALGADAAYGSLPDGDDLGRRVLELPTPGSSNAALYLPLIRRLKLSPQGEVEFEWASIPGRRYRVEGSATVHAPQWQKLAEGPALGTTSSYAEAWAFSNGPRYYRVALLP
jgi:hypothetical protein